MTTDPLDHGASFSMLYEHIDAAAKGEEPTVVDDEPRPSIKRVPSLASRVESEREGRKGLSSCQSDGGLRDRARSKSKSRARSKSRGREPRGERPSKTENKNFEWDAVSSPVSVSSDNEKRQRLNKSLGSSSEHTPQDDRGPSAKWPSPKSVLRQMVDDGSSSSAKENEPSAAAAPRRRGLMRTSSYREPKSNLKQMLVDDESSSLKDDSSAPVRRRGVTRTSSCRELKPADGSGRSRQTVADDDSASPKDDSGPAKRRVGRTSSAREPRIGETVGLAALVRERPDGGGSVASKEEFEELEVKTQLYKEEFQRAQKEKNKIKKEKDQEVGELKKEIEQLRKEIRSSDNENRKLKESLQDGAGSSYKLHVLEDENDRLQAELKGTVERASTMLKERESAIDELMHELELARNESIQTRTMFDATLYKNKMKMEKLDQEKDAYAQRVIELEQLLNSKSKR